jgi:hypothetical protein
MPLMARPAFADSPCLAAANSLLKVKSYEATIVVRNGSTVGLQGTTDIERPSSMHVTEPNIEMIGIGSKGWMRMNGGAWRSTPMALGSLASMDPSTFVKNNAMATCEAAGMTSWHGQPVHVYKETYKAPDGTTARATMYVGSDGFARHIEFSSDKATGSEDFSKFNAVTISPP